MSLLYPDRDWKDLMFHEDHIYPQSAFDTGALRKRGYDDARVQSYQSRYNRLSNLQLITDTENLSKSAMDFADWLKARDKSFRERHLIPAQADYGFDSFESFSDARERLIVERLQAL